MEILERKENLKNPLKTAQKNYVALAFFYIVFGLFFLFGEERVTSIVLIAMGALLTLVARLIGQRKMAGVYIGWGVVAFSIAGSVLGGNLVAILLSAYLGFWNYKAQEAIKGIHNGG